MFHTFVAFGPLCRLAVSFGECFTLLLGHLYKPTNVSHVLAASINAGRFRVSIPTAMFLINVAHLRLVTVQIRRMFALSHGQSQDATNVSLFRRFQAFVPRPMYFVVSLNSSHVSHFRVIDTHECFTLSSLPLLSMHCLFGIIQICRGKFEL